MAEVLLGQGMLYVTWIPDDEKQQCANFEVPGYLEVESNTEWNDPGVWQQFYPKRFAPRSTEYKFIVRATGEMIVMMEEKDAK